MSDAPAPRAHWKSRFGFVLAAAGSAVRVGEHLEVSLHHRGKRRRLVRADLSGVHRARRATDHGRVRS